MDKAVIAVPIELRRLDVRGHGQVAARGTQILADGGYGSSGGAQIAQQPCTSSSVSPSPAIRPDLVGISGR